MLFAILIVFELFFSCAKSGYVQKWQFEYTKNDISSIFIINYDDRFLYETIKLLNDIEKETIWNFLENIQVASVKKNEVTVIDGYAIKINYKNGEYDIISSKFILFSRWNNNLSSFVEYNANIKFLNDNDIINWNKIIEDILKTSLAPAFPPKRFEPYDKNFKSNKKPTQVGFNYFSSLVELTATAFLSFLSYRAPARIPGHSQAV